MTTIFKKALASERVEVLSLLEKANLPINDIDGNVELFCLETDDGIIGTAGLETKGAIGLLRSISISDLQKGKGCGVAIIQHLENYAKSQHLKELYLLTTTAKEFFERKCNYEVVERTDVPVEIQSSQQFSSVCPSSAVVMRKTLVV